MGFNNPSWTWKELEAALSGTGRDGRAPGSPSWNAGGDGPAWSRRRQPFQAPDDVAARRSGSVPYAELHCHSNFSFLDGASHPEELATEAARLGLEALALTDHDGFYGIVRFAEAARAVGLPTVFGTEITLTPGVAAADRLFKLEDDTTTQVATGRVPDHHAPDPDGDHLLLLADGPEGYARVAKALSLGHLAGEKGAPRFSFADVADTVAGHVWVLTGCRKGAVPRALRRRGPERGPPRARPPRRGLRPGPRAGRAVGPRRPARLGPQRRPRRARRPSRPRLRRHHQRPLRHAGPAPPGHRARRGAGPAQRGRARPVAARRRRRPPPLGRRAGPPLRPLPRRRRAGGRDRPGRRLRPQAGGPLAAAVHLPRRPERDGVPPPARRGGRSPPLRRAPGVARGTTTRCGPGPGARSTTSSTSSSSSASPATSSSCGTWCGSARRRTSTARAGGARRTRPSATRSDVTAADAVSLGLLFERFLSPERDGPPDIDIDIESGRREEVIQYLYGKHGRHHTAQVANVITYRAKSAIRDMAKALGHSPGQQDAWSKRIDGWGTVASTRREQDAESRRSVGEHPLRHGGRSSAFAGRINRGHSIPEPVIDLALQVEDAPRHLGIHSGGMVICDRPVIEVCPVEWGRMEDRSVLQWDKDDCAAAGLVKFDLLGLGMLSALHGAVDLIREHRGYEVDLATIPQEDEVYAMLCRADTVGVFQIESRAQMATLPRLRPRRFYDLVVEVALIRPGPIQGGSVHPYIRRRNGEEPVTYLHPLLENSLGKTLGRPAVPGAADADGDRRRRVHAGRVGRAAPGDGVEALGGADGAAARAAVRRDGRAGDHRRRRRRDLREDEGVRQLRLPREPLGVVRLPRVRVVVDQAPRAGRVLRRAAERPADGVLEPAHAGPGRPPPRRRGPHPRPQRQRRHRHPGTTRGVSVAHRAVFGCGEPPHADAPVRHAPARRPVGDRVGAGGGRGPGRGDRGRAALPRPRGPRAAGAGADAGPAGGDGDGRAVRRVLRPRTAGGVVGGRGGGPVPPGTPGRRRDRGDGTDAAGDVGAGGGGGRPVGHGRVARGPPDDRSCARS